MSVSILSRDRLVALPAPFSFFEAMGRVMMDFGFGSLVVKFEEYFGRVITGVLLAVVGVAIFGWGMHFAWLLIIGPVVLYAQKAGLSYATAYNVFGLVIFLTGAITSTFSILRFRNARNATRQIAIAREYRSEADAYRIEAKETMREVMSLQDDFKEKMSTGQFMVEASAALLKSQGFTGQEKLDDILSLLDTGQKTPM